MKPQWLRWQAAVNLVVEQSVQARRIGCVLHVVRRGGLSGDS